MKLNIAIAGATGNVGRKIIEVLEKKNFPVDNLYLLASKNSEGKKITFCKKEIIVEDLTNFEFSKAAITFFCCGSEMSKEWAPIAAKKSIVIDNSSLFRMDQEIPLIVPEVNADDIMQFKNKNIIANPNCSTAQLVVALKPLHDLLSIERVVVSTYQSVSGAGKDPMNELAKQTKQFLNKEKIISENFTKQIAFNVIPHIDEFTDEGYTKEELKMVNETQKILSDKIKLTATCVRVPVLVSHCESVNIQFERSFTLDQIYSTLSSAKGCKVIDERKNGGYITPIEAEGQFDTYISRIRIDSTQKNCLNMWVVSDNLLKGAALNAVQIAETLVDKQLI
ncbi:aspartate-semialdehyde dehydrogenase [Pelagibacteraceae bacterium]|nr:aspartate-semialdehyde dehydrogenase [Pelagibacteraceae bacterium]MDC0412733.1 aspartate-semialdehyde dehydrogenase [Pelagibacteraceae bacterium]